MTSPSLPLVSAEWLREHAGDPHLVIVDATVHLSFDEDGAHIESARDTYLAEHLPHATFIDQNADLSDPGSALRFTPVASEALRRGRRSGGRGR